MLSTAIANRRAMNEKREQLEECVSYLSLNVLATGIAKGTHIYTSSPALSEDGLQLFTFDGQHDSWEIQGFSTKRNLLVFDLRETAYDPVRQLGSEIPSLSFGRFRNIESDVQTALEEILGNGNTHENLRLASHFLRVGGGAKFDGCVNMRGELCLFNNARTLLNSLGHPPPTKCVSRYEVALLRSFELPLPDSSTMRSTSTWNAQNVVCGPISLDNYGWLETYLYNNTLL